MLSRKVDWAILSQCDLYAVKRKVEFCHRIAECLVRPLSDRRFDQSILTNDLWKKTYEIVCKSCDSLNPSFKIDCDSYGGYRLMYIGTENLKPQSVIKAPIGFLRPILDVVTDWSVMRSERTGENLILVGPIRFVNSDCNPNCEYDFSSSLGVVQLRTKRRITRQSELLAKYGPEFFEQNACMCRTCDIEMQAAVNLENSYVDEIIRETVHNLLIEEILSENAPTTVRTMKKRLRQREPVEMYNRITASPVSGYQSQRSPDFAQSRYDISRKRVPSDFHCYNEKPELSESVQSSDEMSEEIQTPQIPRISSPIEYQPLACSVSTVTGGCWKEELDERRSSVML